MKKTIATCLLLILIFSCVFSFVGCANKDGNEDDNKDFELETGLYRYAKTTTYIRIKSDSTAVEYTLPSQSSPSISNIINYQLYLKIDEMKWQLDKENKTVSFTLSDSFNWYEESKELYRVDISSKTKTMLLTNQGFRYYNSDDCFTLIDETDCPQVIKSYEEWLKQQE